MDRGTQWKSSFTLVHRNPFGWGSAEQDVTHTLILFCISRRCGGLVSLLISLTILLQSSKGNLSLFIYFFLRTCFKFLLKTSSLYSTSWLSFYLPLPAHLIDWDTRILSVSGPFSNARNLTRAPSYTFYFDVINMGGSLSRLWSLIWTKKEIRILILGLVCRPCWMGWRRRVLRLIDWLGY